MKKIKMKRKIQKIFVSIVVLLEIFLMNTYPAQAGLFGGGFSLGGAFGMPGGASPNISSILGQVEERYHIDKESVSDFGESFNVSSQKSPAPEVDLFFDPGSPKFGQKITATALPKYFQDSTENMYFTWYLKHASCDEGSSNLAQCDADGNGRVSVNDWKVEAMRLIAQNGFIKEKADYSRDTDNEGFAAVQGGRKNIQDQFYCYIHDFESGIDYEMATTSGEDESFNCSGETVCADPYKATCGQAIKDTTTRTTGTSSGSTAVDPSDPNSSTSTSTSTSTGEFSSTGLTTGTLMGIKFDAYSDSGFAPSCNTNSRVNCPGGTVPMCVGDLNLLDPTCEELMANPSIYANPGAAVNSCTIRVVEDNLCEHQFASTHGSGDVGDNSFGRSEERFWGTNPNDPSTAHNDKNDEANVAGLGADKLTWTYMTDDEVGVIVEGKGYMSTKHADSSNQIMFALPKNIFDKSGSECEIAGKHNYTEKVGGYNVQIPAASIDMNACLSHNLINPLKGNQPDNIDVTITASPKNPNVGSGGANLGDKLVISSGILNQTLDNVQLYFKWSVYGTRETNIENLNLDINTWTPLSNNAGFRKSNNIKLMEGIGLDELNMQLNNIEGSNFLRVLLEVEEFYKNRGNGSSGTTRSGRGDVIIQPNISGDGRLVLTVGGSGDICLGSGNNSYCEVTPSQIITATLDADDVRNYLWTLNGKIITSDPSQISQGNRLSFPVNGNPGETYTLNVVANDTAPVGSESTGNKLNLTKTLAIVQPRMAIGPDNELNRAGRTSCVGETLGSYIDVSDGSTIVDCSENVFGATGSFNVPVTYYPSWIQSEIRDLTFHVNGIPQNSNNVSLAPFVAGSMVSVSATATYMPSQRDVLSRDWGISQFDTAGEDLSDIITVRVGASAPIGFEKSMKVIAGLAHNLSEQLMFMFRMILTTGIIIFVSGMILTLNKREIK